MKKRRDTLDIASRHQIEKEAAPRSRLSGQPGGSRLVISRQAALIP
jgi:hypothetical protein